MIATIDGVTVMGTPEEIKRYKEISESKKQNFVPFKFPDSTGIQVPEHVKKYRDSAGWNGVGTGVMQVWF